MLERRNLYDFVYGKGKGAEQFRRRIQYKILGSPFAVIFGAGGMGAGLSLAQGAGLGGIIVFCIWLLPEVLLYQRYKDIRLSVRMELPNFLDVTALLLEAGQPLWHAVKTASEMGNSEFYQRLRRAFQISGGMEESRNPERLLERFSDELKMPEITSVTAAIIQNSRKGEKELAGALRIQSILCRQERREIAEELGNRASNFMLIPTGMVFMAILIMLIAPAMLQMIFR